MDPNPNVIISQNEPEKKPTGFKFPKRFLIILLGILVILGLIAIFSPSKPLPKIESTNQNPAKETEYKDVVKTTIKIASSSATFINQEGLKLHLASPLDTPPKTTGSSFIFKAELVSSKGQIYYSSWKSYPIKRDPDNSFLISLLTPFQKDAILRIKDIKNQVILVRKL